MTSEVRERGDNDYFPTDASGKMMSLKLSYIEGIHQPAVSCQLAPTKRQRSMPSRFSNFSATVQLLFNTPLVPAGEGGDVPMEDIRPSPTTNSKGSVNRSLVRVLGLHIWDLTDHLVLLQSTVSSSTASTGYTTYYDDRGAEPVCQWGSR